MPETPPGVRLCIAKESFMKHRLFAILTAALFTSIAFGQNVLVNGDFELNPPSTTGNNIPWSIAPWTLGAGQQANVVKVDGPGGFDYGTNGPESDASGRAAGVEQHYLDIADGSNDFYQTFMPQCSGRIEFGGSFSTRANSPGTGSITIREGSGATGTIVGLTNTVDLPGGTSATDPWTDVTYSAPVTAFQTYSFVVAMDNNMNFDEGFVEYLENCQPPDPCCPPWNTSMLEKVLFYQGTGSISAPYLLKYQPNAAFSSQMQSYINYVHSVNPAATQITLNFRLHDGGTGNTPVMGAQLGSQHWVTWTSPSPAPAPQNFFNSPTQLMQVNQWYVVHTGIYLEGGQQFFPASCADNDIGVRIQVVSIPLREQRPVLQMYSKGRITERPLDRMPVGVRP
jgi:hypothetical protein